MTRRIASETIYDALLDDDCFAELPLMLAQAYGGRSTLIYWRHLDGSNEVLGHSGYFSDDQLRLYSENFASEDPWALAAAVGQRENVAMDLEHLVPQSEFERSAFYNEYIRPMGDDTSRCLGIRIRTEWGSGSLGIQRGRGQRQFEAGLAAALDHDAAHVRRMLSIRGKMAGLRRKASCLEAVLDAVPQPALLVRADGCFLYANRAADILLKSSDQLRVRNGKLSGTPSFGAAIAAATSRSNPEAGTALIGATRRPAMVADVVPMRTAQAAGCALVMLHPLHRPVGGRSRALRSLFGLTAAEAEIAERLAGGSSPAEIADQRRVSVQTVRVQIKAIAQKLGCGRQAEIAAVVNSIPLAPHAGG